MKFRAFSILAVLALVAGLFGAAAPSAQAGDAESYILLANGNNLPRGIERSVERAGGTITNTIPEVGIAVVESNNPDFAEEAASIRGLRSVSRNVTLQWIDPIETVAVGDFGNPPTSGDDDFFFDLQWGHDAVDAPEAWEEGFRGDGARVAVLDTGFDLDHPDLVPNINLALSKDFTDEGLQYTLPDTFSHGTHTAGTVAAADNAFGTIGVAPEAELVLVKVLGDAGSGTFADVILGIIHAADVDADVINMSLGARLERGGYLDEGDPENPDDDIFVTAREVAELAVAIYRAVAYADKEGTLVIASAGNDAEDYDHNGDVIHLPSDAPHALSISATGPEGWAIDPTTDLDTPAFYTNYGQSVIDFAAPGGDIDFGLYCDSSDPDIRDCDYPEDYCTIGLVSDVPCWVFDLVFSTGNGGWYWSAGTSMSAPHAAGVAALIIGANGGDMKPAQVEATLRQYADDLGKPGKDDFYGLGAVDAPPDID